MLNKSGQWPLFLKDNAMLRRILIVGFLLVSVLAISGCQSSADILKGHWHELNEIADAHKDNCVDMGVRLSAYLDSNEDSLRKSLSSLGTAKAHEAKDMYLAGKALDDATAHCKTSEMEVFRSKFAKITLESIALDDYQSPPTK